ncbi:MAG: hypothetical protein ACRDA5_06315, partial [Clostridium sp.]
DGLYLRNKKFNVQEASEVNPLYGFTSEALNLIFTIDLKCTLSGMILIGGILWNICKLMKFLN